VKPELLEILCCPVCLHELALTPDRVEGTEILTGRLRCPECGIDYPIEDGIPDLLPPDSAPPPRRPSGAARR
jgi:uncharacterized protein